MPEVLAYVKNQNLDFTIPYEHKGTEHAYVPDFIVRLDIGATDRLTSSLR